MQGGIGLSSEEGGQETGDSVYCIMTQFLLVLHRLNSIYKQTQNSYTCWVSSVACCRRRPARAGLDGGTIKIWDAATGKLQRTLEGHGRRSTRSCVPADGGRLASGLDDGMVEIRGSVSAC